MIPSLRSRAHVLPSLPLAFSHPTLSFRPSSLSVKPLSAAAAAAGPTMSASAAPPVEHIVLFKVKEGTDPSRVGAMLAGLNGLVSLDQVLHLAAGPVLQTRSSLFSFTHMLHSRYRTKDDLAAYSAHPSHMGVVKESVLPICDDIMAVDWVADRAPEALAVPPGSAVKVSFLKLKEGLGDAAKGEVLGVIQGIKDGFAQVEQVTCGENFSPARAKGFSIASLAVFKSVEEMEAAAADEEAVNSRKEKVREYLDGVIVVDYVVPELQPASASL
ncbi:stress-response A/B barrel domain-containing protein UP3 [Eucalyptus grandis]|uniref:stress-response A/B barrel domain-containing protein UP3 n=1 Tax=Eucalyptus grandis TaxID=71139 RepID=UPI00192EA8FB|nr:stress-response A/B barrel domain-containing protein UP3 [Eucalyptus grandis]